MDKEEKNLILLIIVYSLLIYPIIAFSQVDLCGESPPVANDELKGEIKGKAEFLSKFLGNAELSGNIQKSRVEIFSKYPEAERTRSNAYFEYQVCVLLMKDNNLTTIQKIEELKKIRREFSEPVGKKSSMNEEMIGKGKEGGNASGSRILRKPMIQQEFSKSCKDAKYKNSKNIDGKPGVNGKYYVELEDHEGIKKTLVDCDMVTDGGGWTKVKYKPLEKMATCEIRFTPAGALIRGFWRTNTEIICIGEYLRPLVHPFPRFQEIKGLEVRANQIGNDHCPYIHYILYVNDKKCSSGNNTAMKYNEENVWYCVSEESINIVLKHKVEFVCENMDRKTKGDTTEESTKEIWMGAGQGKNYIWVR